MRTRLPVLLLVSAVLALCQPADAQLYPGTNIRGRVLVSSPYMPAAVPRLGVPVELFAASGVPGKWQLVAKTSTDRHGFYYFSKVPLNTYVLRVAGRMNFTVVVRPINYMLQQFQDIPPILLR